LKDLGVFLDYLFSLESLPNASFDCKEDARISNIIAVNFRIVEMHF